MTDCLKKNKVNICLLLLIAGVVSVPLMTDYVLGGAHLQASLSRIEALKDGIGKAFPVRIQPMATGDFGYAAASFQADIFLLLPALFRFMGLGVATSYKLFLLLVNLTTAGISYLCFNKIFGRKEIGWIGSMLYTWCPYRCNDIYINSNLGEIVAWSFVPIVVLGFAQLYSAVMKEKSYEGIWMTLTLGYSLLAVSSTTFFVVALGTAIPVMLFLGRRGLCKEIYICVGKTALATLLINAWFLIPLLIHMSNASNVEILIHKDFRMGGLYLVQYLSIFPSLGDSLNFAKKGVVNAQEMGVGAAVLLLVFAYLLCLFIKKFTDDMGKRLLCVVGVLLILSSNLFPWDLLRNRNMLCSVVLAFLQSPAKWGVMACAGLILVACRMLQRFWEGEDEKAYNVILGGTVAISFATTWFMMSRLQSVREHLWFDTEDWGRIAMEMMGQESIIWRLSEVATALTLCSLFGMWVIRRKQ